ASLAELGVGAEAGAAVK
nr:hypothetical protein [Tanacetum cinerariifolium]